MCGIIGAYISDPTEADFTTIRNIFIESRIRGKHATGLSYIKDGQIWTERTALPADEFAETYEFEQLVNEDGNICFVGHCRYSTSDLLYNQPLETSQISLVHNGVISQELPERWEELYGYKCNTKNDSELLLKSLAEGKSPFIWEDASISGAVLSLYNKQVSFFRNGKRPLYYSYKPKSVVFASTKDILHRAGVSGIAEAKPYVTYFMNDVSFLIERHEVDIVRKKDLQHV